LKNTSAKKTNHWLHNLPGGGNILAAGKNAPIWQLNNRHAFGKFYTEALADANDNSLELNKNDGR
jgi:hypothetical protein